MQERSDFVPEASSSLSLQEYTDILRRRRAVILQTFLLVLVAGTIITFFQTPVYRAVARLLVSPPSYVINSVSTDPLAALFQIGSNYSPNTQVEMIQRGEIRKQVGTNLGAKSLPRVKVSVVEGTSIIEVAAEGENPGLVARTANEYIKVYKLDIERSATQSLDNALTSANAQKNAAEKAAKENLDKLTNLKVEKNLPDIDGTRVALQDVVKQIAVSYNAARAQADESQRKIAAAEAKLASMPQTRSDVPTWQADPATQQLQNRIDDLDTELKALGEDLGTNNLAVVVKAKQMAEYRRRLAEYKKNFRDRTQRLNPVYQTLSDQIIQLEIDATASSGRAATLAQGLSEAQARLDTLPKLESEYLQYSTAAQANADRAKYWGDRARDIQLRLESSKNSTNIRDIEQAVTPIEPIRPNRRQNILLAGVVGLFLGLGLALLLELLDDRINSPEEAERVLRLPNLGHVPLVEEEGLRLIRDINSFAGMMESYRALRTNINFAAVGTEMRSLLVTSSLPAEGKSTTAANLAMAIALDGRKVILVDADLRRPNLHRLFRIDPSPGLTDVLVETHSIEEVLRPSGVDRVLVLPAGSPPPNPAELLGSSAMANLIAELEKLADVVIFDSPPTLPVSDSIVLSSQMDGVLLVVAFGETRKSTTRKAIELLGRAKANILGTVLNRMESSGSGYYGYYNYGKYSYVPASVDGVAPGASVPSSTSEPRAVASAPEREDASVPAKGDDTNTEPRA